MTKPAFHPAILAARERLAQQREKIKRQHAGASPGIQVCALMAGLLDSLVLDLWQAALEMVGEAGENGLGSQVALVAHGGYGRRDVAPYSDVDLMLLHPAGSEKRIEPLARRLIMNVGDAGLSLGFSVRTPAQARRMAMDDVTVFTSLAEHRHLYGSLSLFTRFAESFQRQARWRVGSLVAEVERSRADERGQYGESVYMLTPNIKRSQGGLRDIQLVRWVGFARWGQSSLSGLRRAGALSEEDYRTLHDAREFLLRLRNEMHFHAGKAHDTLDRGEQVRLAAHYGFQGEQGVLPVEQFMREYFRQTGEVWHVASHFVDSARRRSVVARLFGPVVAHRMDRDFLVGPIHITATRRGREKIRGDLAEVLRLMDLANFMDKGIDHATWKVIRDAAREHRDEGLSPETARRFISLLSQRTRLPELLRRLHEVRLLEQIIPAVAHVRGLVQFNEFHKYTVDEHSLRAVECATGFHHDDGPLGEAYRSVKQKHLLHLALLIHDLGKGFDEDHSEVGQRIAEAIGERLQLSARETETLKFLVHKHLLMSHVAFRRDLDDPATPLQLAVEVGSPSLLQMLYVLTCADLAAVGPGVLNHWKLQLLTELYRRALPHVAGDAPGPGSREWLARRRSEVRKLAAQYAGPSQSGAWWDRQIAALPPSYLNPASVEFVLEELERLRTLSHREAIASGRYLADLDAVAYTIGAYEEITPGVFHKLAGALSSKGHNILSAEINTLAEGLVLDRFYVQDLDFTGEPPAERIDEVCLRLVDSLKDTSGKPPTFRKTWKAAGEGAADFNRVPTRVRIDNATSENSTIIDVFAHDRTGLLYTIGRALFELDLSVRFAKIGTVLDQVVDVFYVTDSHGRKIMDEHRLQIIRQRLLEAVDQVEAAVVR
jgi:[protein-PII] uridylyltransferase